MDLVSHIPSFPSQRLAEWTRLRPATTSATEPTDGGTDAKSKKRPTTTAGREAQKAARKATGRPKRNAVRNAVAIAQALAGEDGPSWSEDDRGDEDEDDDEAPWAKIDSATGIYMENQVGAMCSLHSVNMMIGQHSQTACPAMLECVEDSLNKLDIR